MKWERLDEIRRFCEHRRDQLQATEPGQMLLELIDESLFRHFDRQLALIPPVRKLASKNWPIFSYSRAGNVPTDRATALVCLDADPHGLPILRFEVDDPAYSGMMIHRHFFDLISYLATEWSTADGRVRVSDV